MKITSIVKKPNSKTIGSGEVENVEFIIVKNLKEKSLKKL